MFENEKWGKFAFILGISLLITLAIQIFIINNSQIEVNEAMIKVVNNLQDKVYSEKAGNEIIICSTQIIGKTLCATCRGVMECFPLPEDTNYLDPMVGI